MSIIENMGWSYLGPVNGHDIASIRRMIRFAKLLNRPVLIHCVTHKGLGASYAERDPDLYHGAGAFDAATGKPASAHVRCYSDIFGEELVRLARRDVRICAVTAAMKDGTGLSAFAREFPRRFFDVGIAEQHAVTMSAGLAKAGRIPVCAVYSTFLQRAYDQLLHDVSIDPVHVVFAVDRAGIVPGDGETHQGTFDVAYFADIPGLTLYAPASFSELVFCLDRAVCGLSGPAAVRYPKGGEGAYKDCDGRDASVIRGGADAEITIVCYGALTNEALAAAEILASQGLRARVLKLLKLLPPPDLAPYADRPMLFAEDVMRAGSVGERALASFAERGISVRARRLDLGERFLPCGSVRDLREESGLDARGIARAAQELCRMETV